MDIFEKPLPIQIKSKIVSRLCIAAGYFNYFNRFKLLLAEQLEADLAPLIHA